MTHPLKVDVRHLTKRFKIYSRPVHRLAEWMTFGAVRMHREFTALEDISFSMHQGDFFGVIGPNGSGKSTLLKILTEVMWPTSGSFRVEGRVTSLLELGTGFNPELTGRENMLNSSWLLGFSERYIRERMGAMIEFADIDAYIDQPIKYYSSGMMVRLAFSIFSHVEPDVFIVDEALSVGDIYFSQKCFQRLDQMRAAGCTLLFVSHDLQVVRKYCDRALYLHFGECRFLGPAIGATDVYLEAMSPGGAARKLSPESDGRGAPEFGEQAARRQARTARESLPAELADVFDEAAFLNVLGFNRARIGSGEVRIAAVGIRDADGRPRERFTANDAIHVHILAEVKADVENATVSVQFTNRMGIVVWGTNHERLGGKPTRLRERTWSHSHFAIAPGLGAEQYTLDVGYGDAAGEGHVFDRLTAVAQVEVAPEGHFDFLGLARVPCECEVTAHDMRERRSKPVA